MELLNKSESEILEAVTPITKSMADAWSNDDYEKFISYFEVEKKAALNHEAFTKQRSWVAEELGTYSLNRLDTIHINPSNIVITWKVDFANRDEPGLGIYRFKEVNGKLLVSSCIYFH